MPLSLIQVVLGTGFVLTWAFIGLIIFGDVRRALDDERESAIFRAHAGHPSSSRPHAKFPRGKQSARPPRRTSAA